MPRRLSCQALRDICPYLVGRNLPSWSHPAVVMFTEVTEWCEYLITLSCKKRAWKSPLLKSQRSLNWHLKKQLFPECEQEETVSFIRRGGKMMTLINHLLLALRLKSKIRSSFLLCIYLFLLIHNPINICSFISLAISLKVPISLLRSSIFEVSISRRPHPVM